MVGRPRREPRLPPKGVSHLDTVLFISEATVNVHVIHIFDSSMFEPGLKRRYAQRQYVQTMRRAQTQLPSNCPAPRE
jgi:hypothetical protein